jgi:hypothetical protein
MEITPRLALDDVRWVSPDEPRMTGRDWARADRRVSDNLRAVDRGLSAWAGFEPKAAGMDMLLDERLFWRPPDVMATWPVPARPIPRLRPSVPVIPGH